MKIALFGATGFLGRHIVKEALERGIALRVLARDPAKLGEFESRVEVVRGDYFVPEDQAAVLEGADAVMSTIGPLPGKKSGPGVEDFGNGMRALTRAMKEKGLTRIVTVAGAGTSYEGEKIDFGRKIMRLLLNIMGPVVTPAKELELSILRSSGLQFTTVRPPMIAENVAGTFKTSGEKTQGMKVDAAQLAGFMLDIVEEPEWHGKMPFVGTGR